MSSKRAAAVLGNWTEAALHVCRERYFLRDGDGNVLEGPEQMCRRVAAAIAAAEDTWQPSARGETEDTFFQLMASRKFMPNSPTLSHAGTGNGHQLAACFVLPVPDSIQGIFDGIKQAAIIHQSGGGTGMAFSRLRPEGATVRSTRGVASGPVSFMRIFNEATEQIKQGGTRRGANMGILRVDHPDIEKFIDCKRDGSITNFNISVAATDVFMQALLEGADYELRDPRDGTVVGTRSAAGVFERIVDAAWASGDPGMVFIDRINAGPANPTPELGEVEATNPCGEQPLLPYEACNLGSLNVAEFLKPDGAGLDWDELGGAVRTAVRFLDDLIEINPYPLPETEEMVHGNRRIGLGVMGWADLLFQLGIPYDSEAALGLAEKLMQFINSVGHRASAELAEVRGPFKNFARSIYRDGPPLRNSTVTTIAPTGTISIIAGTSSGIEPAFALAYVHKAPGKDGKPRNLRFVNPIFERVAHERGFDGEELMARVLEQGTLHGLGVPEDVRRVFVTSHEVDPDWHVRMQAAFQRHTDNAVSKTVNLPAGASREDVARAYRSAYALGCIGITVFRDGCKGGQILERGDGEQQAHDNGSEPPAVVTLFADRSVKPRPVVVHGYTRQVKAPEGTVNITVNSDANGPLEVFVNLGHAGSDSAAMAEAIGRLISLTLRLPSPLTPAERLNDVASQLRFIGGSRTIGFGVEQIRSLPDAVAQALEKHLEGNVPPTPENTVLQGMLPLDVGSNGHHDSRPVGEMCPKCKTLGSVVWESGCRRCRACFWDAC